MRGYLVGGEYVVIGEDSQEESSRGVSRVITESRSGEAVDKRRTVDRLAGRLLLL
jgi:hypothetical protein